MCLYRISDEPSIIMTQMFNSGTGYTDNDSVDRKPGHKPYNDDIDTKKRRISTASSEVSMCISERNKRLRGK